MKKIRNLVFILSLLVLTFTATSCDGSGKNLILDFVKSVFVSLFTVPESNSRARFHPDYFAGVFISFVMGLFAVGLVHILRTLAREKKERLIYFTPEIIRKLVANPAADANRKADSICEELEDYPAIDNHMIAHAVHQRLLDAVALGPTSPDVLERMNRIICVLNESTKRSFAFPGITSDEKHGCVVKLMFVIIFISAAGRVTDLIPVPPILALFFPAAIVLGLYLSAKTPGYLQETMHESLVFDLMLRLESAVSSLGAMWAAAFGLTLAFAVAFASIGVIFLIPLAFYLICRNYIFTSAGGDNEFIGDFPLWRYSMMLRNILYVAAGISMVVVFFLTEMKYSVGMLLWLFPIVCFPELYRSCLHSHFSVANILPQEKRGAALSSLSSLGSRYFIRALFIGFFWIFFVSLFAFQTFHYQTEKKAYVKEQKEIEDVKAAEEYAKQQEELQLERAREKEAEMEHRQQQALERQRESEERRAEAARLREERRQQQELERQREREERQAEAARLREERSQQQAERRQSSGRRQSDATGSTASQDRKTSGETGEKP